MSPSELCSILHELFVGYASKRVCEFDVGFGDRIVNGVAGLRLLLSVGTFFIRVLNGTNWTFLDIGTFGRHSGPEGGKLQHLEGWSFSRMVFIRLGDYDVFDAQAGTVRLDTAVELNRASNSFRQLTASLVRFRVDTHE